MRKYDSYKNSGVKWLGEIPSHWEIMPIKRIARTYAGATPNSSNDNNWGGTIPWITPADFKTETKYVDKGDRFLTEQGLNSCSTTLVPAKSVIFSKRAPVGQLSIATQPLCTNQGCISCIPLSVIDSSFFFYLLSIHKDTFESLSCGTTFKEISQKSFVDFKISLPPINEQIMMVSYLDATTSKIDEAIAQQQKMIDLLNERKQIIINKVVTKGLDPNVKMKPSGIDWIGDIPEHWEMKRLKTILSVKDKRNTDPEALLLSVYTAIGVRPRQELEERGNKASSVLNYKMVSKGDLIVNRLLAWMGAYGLSNYNGVTSPDYDVYSFHADVNRGYYETLFRNTQFNSDCYKYGHGIMLMRWRTYPNEFLNIMVPVPPLEEQRMIYSYLLPQIEKMDKNIDACNKIITLLKERKQIIINEVVTGKVKVI